MAKVRSQAEVRGNALDKQAESQKRSKVYNTEKIMHIVKDQASGGSPDMNPFWHGQTDYRDQGIAFEYTDEELEELDKCANDCIYFVAHYCKFLNDKGRTLVDLRNYQERLLNLMSQEKYDPVSDTIIPSIPKLVLMQSRQTGKCIPLSESIAVSPSSAAMIERINNTNYTFHSWFNEKIQFIKDLFKIKK